ncbi:hypothetical protein C8Q76DRAFT_755830 [Earliella scabrosa]|nr:hypothetical protein C8Q76DRAFT_755830 [Earliella scabrosa]
MPWNWHTTSCMKTSLVWITATYTPSTTLSIPNSHLPHCSEQGDSVHRCATFRRPAPRTRSTKSSDLVAYCEPIVVRVCVVHGLHST